MTGNEKLKKPTISQLVSAVKEHNGLDITKKDITDDIYTQATKGFERGVSLKSMANRVRFYLAGSGNDSEPKETVSSRGILMGSRDIANGKKPLGKNKSQSVSYLEEGADGMFRVFSDPNVPSHFKGLKKDKYFGTLVDTDLSFSKTGDITYVTPENITIVDKSFEIDTSKIKVYPITALPDLEEYTACAVVGTISSLRLMKMKAWDQDKYPDNDDYPLIVNGNPVFSLYLESDDESNEPVIDCSINPTHLAKPYITLEDFKVMIPDTYDSEMDYDDFMHDEITPMYNGVEVIVIGQMKDVYTPDDGKMFVHFDVTAIIPVEGSPSLIETKSGVKKAKDVKAKKGKDKPTDKKDSKKDAAEKEVKKAEIRQAEVAKVVTAMMDATTVDVVKEMVEKKYLTGVSDEVIQKYIDAEFEAQGIPMEEEREETPSEDPDSEMPVDDDEPENVEDEDDVWAE